MLASTDVDLRAIAWLWLTEGCPHGLKPWMYQWFRKQMAKAADVEMKAVSLVGSFRLGFSLSPLKAGEQLNSESDMDALVVSSRLYNELLPLAKTVVEDRPDLQIEVRRCEQRQFVETQYIPPGRRSPRVQAMHDCFWYLSRSPFMMEFDHSHSSIRVYHDWDCAIRQMVKSLAGLRKALGEQSAGREYTERS
jgi:hypothetical protein